MFAQIMATAGDLLVPQLSLAADMNSSGSPSDVKIAQPKLMAQMYKSALLTEAYSLFPSNREAFRVVPGW